MSGRPFLGHADMPTPSVHSRPSFVPPLRIGGGSGPARSHTQTVAAPVRVTSSVVSKPPPAAAPAFGGGGGGGSRMAFKPAGGGDGSNLYIYRPPTNVYHRAPVPSSSPSPSPPPAGGTGSAPPSGITRGPPSATESKMIGGPNRDYVMPSKASFTPFGPSNAPYAQRAAAGARPITNAFRAPIPNIRTTVRVKPRRPKARRPKSSSANNNSSGDDEADDDAPGESWDDDAPDASSEPMHGTSTLRRKGVDRPSSAFRGASPRAPPPEAFEPDWVGLGQLMSVTSRNSLPGASSKRTTGSVKSKASSKAASVASSARSTAVANKPVPPVSAYDPDDPFAEDSPPQVSDDAALALAQGDANAGLDDANGESPRSHRSIASHASARSHVSRASQHSAGWYTRQFHLTGDLAKDMLILQEKAAALQAQVNAQKLNQSHMTDEKEQMRNDEYENDEEEEVFAEDGEQVDDADHEHDHDGAMAMDEAQADEDERAAEHEEEAARADESIGSDDQLYGDERDREATESNDEFGDQSEEFQPDDLDESHDNDDDGESSNRMIASHQQPSSSPPSKPLSVDPSAPPPSRKVLRPSNAWAQREPLISPPHLYTTAQWGTQTQSEMALLRLREKQRQTNGNETSDIDTEMDTEAENDDSHDRDDDADRQSDDDVDSDEDRHTVAAAAASRAPPSATALEPEDDSDPFATSGDENDQGDAQPTDLNSTALFVVHANTLTHGPRKSGFPSSSPTASSSSPFASTQSSQLPSSPSSPSIPNSSVPPSDSEDESGVPTSALLTASGSAKNLFANIMQKVNQKAMDATIAIKPITPKAKKKPVPPSAAATTPASPPHPITSSTNGSPSSSSSLAPVCADPPNDLSDDPAPAVDYMSVLKKKGVTPLTESDRRQIQESNDSIAQIRRHEETLAALRAREQELRQMKLQQLQQNQQQQQSPPHPSPTGPLSPLTHRSDASDPFASPRVIPTTLPSNRNQVPDLDSSLDDSVDHLSLTSSFDTFTAQHADIESDSLYDYDEHHPHANAGDSFQQSRDDDRGEEDEDHSSSAPTHQPTQSNEDDDDDPFASM